MKKLYSSINTPYAGRWQLLMTCSGRASNKCRISKTSKLLNPNVSVTIYFPPVSLLLLLDHFLFFLSFFFCMVVAERGWNQPKLRTYLIALVYCCLKWGESSVWAMQCWLAFIVYGVKSLFKILQLSDCSNQCAMSECTLVFWRCFGQNTFVDLWRFPALIKNV